MIPKIIHYCWFGRGEKSDLINNCIKSWRKYCPDYEIKEWNEDNFDVYSNQYCREAYENKKWAFVADYARLCVLKDYGGIYMDTDMELIKSLDYMLDKHGFIGFESPENIGTAIIGAEKNNEWINSFLKTYSDRSMILKNGRLDLSTNVIKGTLMLKEMYDIKLDGKYQNIENVMEIFPVDYFCPKDFCTGVLNVTPNTIGIHHYDSSWCTKIQKKVYQKRVDYVSKYGEVEGMRRFEKWFKRNTLWIHLRRDGFDETLKLIKKRLFVHS